MMPPRLTRPLLLGCLLLASYLFSSQSGGQTLHSYEPFVETPEYRKALGQVSSGYSRAQGVQAFLDLAAAHPGTTLGAKCLFEAASFGEDESRLDGLLQRIVNEYPGSRFEMHARSWQLSRRVTSLEEYFDGVDQLAQSFGAPTLKEISANPTRAVRKLRALPAEFRNGMAQVYSNVREVQLGSVKNRLPEALATTQFGLDAYFDDGIAYRSFDCRKHFIIAEMNGGWQSYEGQRSDPVVKLISPKPNQRTGPRPSLRLNVNGGDFYHTGLDLQTEGTRFRLDGRDILPELDVRSRLFPIRKAGHPTEKYRIRFRPSQPLTKGLHTFEVVLIAGGYQGTGPGRTALQWNFTVQGADDDRDDDRRCEKWDQEESDWDDD